MIATVAASSIQYHHTVNTLKYADRAKEIKTHVRQNTGTVQEHVAQYQAIIDDLKDENNQLKEELNSLQVSSCWRQPGSLADAHTMLLEFTAFMQKPAFMQKLPHPT